ncbi:MAG: hypothetical protein KGL62_11855, partial [Bradyrhizobium sp.]|uniref:hypothetical protein n=1 Tax=Bradyrhizobium sp. TaxID=376 RepID=UPI00239BA16C
TTEVIADHFPPDSMAAKQGEDQLVRDGRIVKSQPSVEIAVPAMPCAPADCAHKRGTNRSADLRINICFIGCPAQPNDHQL